ncbi:MAG: TetR/AcrR family transcriptional regulator [Magnetococcales bacterium]|nr:TetR/AcrR family transcriptional regulator [Magnetococcales bacterium]MBF0261039.1 TetR/AcrR family transcriptional regulator [Magnetococcales bacterium]
MTRNPDETRARLLGAAFEEIHRHGFQGASLTGILARAEVTKGAMYHHFASKQELGYAVVDEVLKARLEAAFFVPLSERENFIDGLLHTMAKSMEERGAMLADLGCPLNNLAQEMSPVDEGFRVRVDRLFGWWRDGLAEGLRRAIALGQVRGDIDPEGVALFYLAALEGCIGLAKNARSVEMHARCLGVLAEYVNGLRA